MENKEFNSFEDFIKSLSNEYDMYFVKSPDLVGGKLFFELQTEQNRLSASCDFYYKKEDGKWTKKTENRVFPFKSFSESAVAEMKSKFSDNNKIEFSIDSPTPEQLEELKKKEKPESFVFNSIISICSNLVDKIDTKIVNLE